MVSTVDAATKKTLAYPPYIDRTCKRDVQLDWEVLNASAFLSLFLYICTQKINFFFLKKPRLFVRVRFLAFCGSRALLFKIKPLRKWLVNFKSLKGASGGDQARCTTRLLQPWQW